MKLRSMRQQVMQGMDPNDPKSVAEAIKTLAQNNDREGAFKLAASARDAAASNAKTGLAVAQTKKAEGFQQATVASERNRNLITGVEVKLAENPDYKLTPKEEAEVRYQVQQEIKPKAIPAGPNGELMTIEPFNVSEAAPNLTRYLSAKGATFGKGPALSVTDTPASIAAKEAGVVAAQGTIAGIDDSLNAVKGIRDLRAGSITTNPWLVRFAKDYPSAAMAQDDLVKTITAGKVIDTIAEMKAQSKTGATGFGALTGRELDQLEAKARRLNPSSPTFEADLKYIEDKLIDSKNKIQSELTKKKPAMPSSPANNAAGTEGRIAILQQEYANAVRQGNQADIAGLTRELATLGAKPSTAGAQKSTLTFEQKVQRTMADNPNATRANVEAKLRAAGHQ